MVSAAWREVIRPQSTRTSRAAESPDAGAVKAIQQDQTGIQEAPGKKPIRALDADEVKLLMKQGEQFANLGDLATARLSNEPRKPVMQRPRLPWPRLTIPQCLQSLT
jgi:hypothetical protein